ncbi:hypothetical protein [Rhodococcus koreensis]|uniref:hypothetical protein n=1 Tax=Rhodococcus koreensis TaxID=99653 RepID=UPI00366FDDF8
MTTLVPSAHPHIITTPARTGTNVELRIHTSLAVFEVAAEPWAPAVSGSSHSITARPRPDFSRAGWECPCGEAVATSNPSAITTL